jgi:nucleotide-binding universal stress UspA family protein
MISLKNVLCPIDHSDCSKEALKYAVTLAMRDKAKLLLLHIIDIRSFSEGLEAMSKPLPDEETLEQLRAKLLDCIPEEIRDDMDVEATVIQGIPFAEIISTAKKKRD